MVAVSIVLLVLGIISMVAELFVPGFGVFGIGGFIAVVTAFALCFSTYGIFAVIIELIVTLAVVGLVFMYIKKYKLHGKIVLEDRAVNDNTNLERYYNGLIGKEGTAKTALRPCGNVKFDDKTIEVFSDGEFIEADEKVRAVRVSENKLYVERCKEV